MYFVKCYGFIEFVNHRFLNSFAASKCGGFVMLLTISSRVHFQSARQVALLSLIEHGSHLTYLNLKISKSSGLIREGGSCLIDKSILRFAQFQLVLS